MSTTISKNAKQRTAQEVVAKASSNPPIDAVPWYRSTLAMGLYGGLLLYVSFPPWSILPQTVVSLIPGASDLPWLMTGAKLLPCLLAWVATVPWLLLVRMERLPGRRPYRMLYLAGLVHWLLLVQWVRLGHWAAHFGWIALTLYLAAYLPAFIWLTRTATRRLRLPLLIAAPTIWVGLEVLRGWLLTGFSMALLAHTQVEWLSMIQISDLAGAYTVSFVVMFIAACITQMIPLRGSGGSPARRGVGGPPAQATGEPSVATGRRIVCLALAIIAVLVAVLTYGRYRLTQEIPGQTADSQRIAIVQGSIDTDFDDPTVGVRTRDQYSALNAQAVALNPDAIVWPESTLVFSAIERDPSGIVHPPRGLDGLGDEQRFREELDKGESWFHFELFQLGGQSTQGRRCRRASTFRSFSAGRRCGWDRTSRNFSTRQFTSMRKAKSKTFTTRCTP